MVMPGSWKNSQPSSFESRWKLVSFDSRGVRIGKENLKQNEQLQKTRISVHRCMSRDRSHVSGSICRFLQHGCHVGMVVICTHLSPTTVPQHMPLDPVVRVRHPIRLDPLPHTLPQSPGSLQRSPPWVIPGQPVTMVWGQISWYSIPLAKC